MPAGRAGQASWVHPASRPRGERQRTRTGRGAHDGIQRNGRGPDAGAAVSPRHTRSTRAVHVAVIVVVTRCWGVAVATFNFSRKDVH
eukprot:gene22742-biopygen20769